MVVVRAAKPGRGTAIQFQLKDTFRVACVKHWCIHLACGPALTGGYGSGDGGHGGVVDVTLAGARLRLPPER